MARIALGKKARFEVLKRDNFTCKYCGAKAPEVILQVDHIVPVSKGGSNDQTNLVTACQPCNSGKSDRELRDTQVIDAQRDSLEDRQARAEQIQMLADWGNSLVNDPTPADAFFDVLGKAFDASFNIHAATLKKINKVINDFGFEAVMESLKVAIERYNDAGKIIEKIGGICRNKQLESDPRTAWAYKFANSLVYTKAIRSTGKIGYLRKELQSLYETYMFKRTHIGDEEQFSKEEMLWEYINLINNYSHHCCLLEREVLSWIHHYGWDTDKAAIEAVAGVMHNVAENDMYWHYTRYDVNGGDPNDYDTFSHENRMDRLNGEKSL